MNLPASERRTVAVLFAQVSGAEAIPDPVAAHRLLDDVFLRLREAIESRGGALDKIVGSTVMAVFGAPVAHSDDPLRAVLAALDMRQAVAAPPFSLTLRAGINAGEVLWGSVGGDRPTVMGDVVNVAQRLMEVADAGTVLVEAGVERFARRRAGFRRLPPFRLRGRVEAVEACEAVADRGEETERPDEKAGSPFLGRADEMARLRRLLDEGRGGFVLVLGEAGIGKSRLLGEFGAVCTARTPALRFTAARASEEARIRLGPFAKILRAETGASDAEGVVAALQRALDPSIRSPIDRENAAHLIALSVGLEVPGARVRHIAPERVQAETAGAWERWLRARAPGVLCVEDLHWADSGTVELLEDLAARLAGVPVLLIATARPGGPAPRGAEILRIGDLDPLSLRGLAEAVLGAPLSADLASFLAEKSGGNPYYCEELSRFLRAAGLVAGEPLALLSTPRQVPSGLNGLLVARLDALDAAVKETLKVASVIGREFWEGLLGRLLGRDAAADVGEARRCDLADRHATSLIPDDVEDAFRHALLRDAAYSLLTKKDRQRLHTAAASELEGRADSLGRRVAALAARQREAAGQPAEAARLYAGSAVGAAGEFAWAEALGLAQEAERLGAGAAATLVAVEACQRLARFREALDRAMRIARGDAFPAERARALNLASAAHLGLGELRESLAAAEEAVALAPEGLIRSEARLKRAEALRRIGRPAEALEETLHLAPAEPEGRALRIFRGDVLEARAQILLMTGDYDAALEAIDESLILRRDVGDRAGEATCFLCKTSIHQHRGDFESALPPAEQALEIIRQTGDRKGIEGILYALAGVQYGRRKQELAYGHLMEALSISREIGDRAGLGKCLFGLGNLLTDLPSAQDPRAAYLEALAIARSNGDRGLVALCLNSLARDSRSAGKLQEAREFLLEALAIERDMGDRSGLAHTHHRLGQVLSDLGATGEARSSLESALSLFRELRNSLKEAEILQALGLLDGLEGLTAAGIGKLDRAVSYFETHSRTLELRDALIIRSRLVRGIAPGRAKEDALRLRAMGEAGTGTRAGTIASLRLAEIALEEGRVEEAVRQAMPLTVWATILGASAPEKLHVVEDAARVLIRAGRREEGRAAAAAALTEARRMGCRLAAASLERLASEE